MPEGFQRAPRELALSEGMPWNVHLNVRPDQMRGCSAPSRSRSAREYSMPPKPHTNAPSLSCAITRSTSSIFFSLIRSTGRFPNKSLLGENNQMFASGGS